MSTEGLNDDPPILLPTAHADAHQPEGLCDAEWRAIFLCADCGLIMNELIFREISSDLQAEKGMGGVCIWRSDKSEDHFFKGSVGEFLADPANQKDVWNIDGGWGGPPGPIVVRWHAEGYWENGGFCGRRFKDHQ